MDPNFLAAASKTNAPRKVRFAPKAPPTRVQKPVVSKVEKVEDDTDAAQAQELLRRLNESSMMGRTKTEKKVAPSQVAFGHGGSLDLKSYGGSPQNLKRSQNIYPGGSAANPKVDKEYKEPWDYYSYYPVTLPLRRPYSGDPELLDGEEFREGSENLMYDESSSNAALDLGLMDENPEPTMIFFQLPSKMPMLKETANPDGNEASRKSKPRSGHNVYNLDELPAGFMGKMLVYKSGAVKLKLGDSLYDVSTGMDCAFAQDVLATNTAEKHCCTVGELSKRAIISPDVEDMLESILDL